MVPEFLAQTGLSFMQISAVLRAYWKHALVIFLSITCVAVIALLLLPKTYTATATLIVNLESKDPLAAQTSPAFMLGNFVATQTELIHSPAILMSVVDKLSLTQDRDYRAGFHGKDPNALREYVEKSLASSLQVEPGRGGQLFYVAASARSPAQAAAIANAVADAYLAEQSHRVNDPAVQRAKLYAEDLTELRAKVISAQDKVAVFRQKNNITNIAAADTDTEMQALTTLGQKLLDAQNVRRALEARTTEEKSSTDEILASQLIQGLKTQLSSQQSQLAQVSSTLGPKHPKVLELQSQIAATRQSIHKETQTLSDNVATDLGRAKALEEKLLAAMAAQRGKVVKLRQMQDLGSKVTLEMQSAEAVYKRALDGYDQIMFASASNQSNVSFVSRASPPAKAEKPDKNKLLIMSSLAGLVLGLTLPFLYELLFNRRLRCRDDIEREFGLPVLAEFSAAAGTAGSK